jgi:hypothetical protein
MKIIALGALPVKFHHQKIGNICCRFIWKVFWSLIAKSDANIQCDIEDILENIR